MFIIMKTNFLVLSKEKKDEFFSLKLIAYIYMIKIDFGNNFFSQNYNLANELMLRTNH